jgi:hypothetical protein
MKSVVYFLKGIVAALIHDLVPAFKNFFLLLMALFRRCCKKKGVRRCSCTHIAHPAFKRPDPMIYDQYYLMPRHTDTARLSPSCFRV